MISTAVLGVIILGLCVVLFLTNRIQICAVGCLGCLLMVLLKVVPFEVAFSGFGNDIVLLMASAMIVGIAMFRTGMAQKIGLTANRMAKGNERRFLISSSVLGAGMAMFFANTAIVAAFIPIIDGICQSNTEMKRCNLLLPITCSIMIGGGATLIGCTPQLTADAFMIEALGYGFDMWTLTAPALCILVIYLLYSSTIGYNVGNKIWGDRQELQMESENEITATDSDERNTHKKQIIMGILLIMMIILYITEIIPVTQTAILTALLCVLTGCCTVRDINKNLAWDTVIFLATCLGLAQSLTEAGSGELIGNAVHAALGNAQSPFLIFAAIVALTFILSQFITNSTAIIITLPIGISLCTVYDLSPMTFCVGITLAASFAFCTPLAAAQIAMTQVAGYEFSDYFKYGLVPTLIMYAGILVFVPLFYPLNV